MEGYCICQGLGQDLLENLSLYQKVDIVSANRSIFGIYFTDFKMPMKKAFTLPGQNRYLGPSTSSTSALQHRYSQNHQEIITNQHTHPNGDLNASTRTRYTRQQPSFVPILSKESSIVQSKRNTASKKTPSKSLTRSQSGRNIIQDIDVDYSTQDTTRMNGQMTNSNNSRRNSQRNKNIELEYLSSDIPVEIVRDSDNESIKKMSNPLQQLYFNNGYDDENTTSQHVQQNNKQQYDDTQRSKYGNSNMDLVSLHSMISRKSLAGKDVGDEWMIKLAYSFTGVLLWIFITLCIEEIDGTTGEKVCHSNQEVRYWASFVCLVVVMTAATIYFQKGNATESIVMFLLNSITLVSINHAPLSCIRTGRLDDRDMGRLRGGFLLFLLLAIIITWLLKKYLTNKKPLLW